MDNLKLNMRRLNKILSILIERMEKMDNEGRDIPILWNKMHMFSSSQLIKLLAMKRNLNLELAGIIAALHDIGTIMSRSSHNHARVGVPFAKDVIDEYNRDYGTKRGCITEDEISIILSSIKHHSSKDEYSEDPYIELMKDVDSLDRYLHGVPTDGHHKTRLENAVSDLGL